VTRILVVEDNENLRRGLRDLLELEGFEVVESVDGPQALSVARAAAPDLIVLDLMLPAFGGERVLRTLRDDGSQTPILVLTAKRQEEDKVRALQLGADDYVTKPFGRKELTARIAALLRRAKQAGAATEAVAEGARVPGSSDLLVTFGDVTVDARVRAVVRAGKPVPLSPKEFELLLALVRRNGAIATRDELLREVWGYQPDVRSRTVDLHMLELRRKLESDPTRPQHLITVRKLGYRFAANRELTQIGTRGL
jgi:DNA-binding response OmpR family regulator